MVPEAKKLPKKTDMMLKLGVNCASFRVRYNFRINMFSKLLFHINWQNTLIRVEGLFISLFAVLIWRSKCMGCWNMRTFKRLCIYALKTYNHKGKKIIFIYNFIQLITYCYLQNPLKIFYGIYSMFEANLRKTSSWIFHIFSFSHFYMTYFFSIVWTKMFRINIIFLLFSMYWIVRTCRMVLLF